MSGDLAPAVAAFQRAAARVPAYRRLLAEAGINPAQVCRAEDFTRLPVLEKRTTFQRFGIEELCVDGKLGRLASVLTSSGHSGIFAFGLTPEAEAGARAGWIDDLLDELFQVRTQPALLINCLPMGVKIPTAACTLAETSVRADMAVGLVRAFGAHFAQIILVGETAFIKHLLELGRRAGVDWKDLRVHVIVGEEMLAENGRRYLETLLHHNPTQPQNGMVVSSLGIAEVGLNLFSEAPPAGLLARVRRLLHENAGLRHSVFGPTTWVPSLFTYDPRRLFVEFDVSGRLVLTTLDPAVRVPLIRYATGDFGEILPPAPALRPAVESIGLAWEQIRSLPLVAIRGRGAHVLVDGTAVHPEAIKEAIYRDPDLAALTTANFRLRSANARVNIRIQLSRGTTAQPELEQKFSTVLAHYVRAPFTVVCEAYERFAGGMELDYERKFQYFEG